MQVSREPARVLHPEAWTHRGSIRVVQCPSFMSRQVRAAVSFLEPSGEDREIRVTLQFHGHKNGGSGGSCNATVTRGSLQGEGTASANNNNDNKTSPRFPWSAGLAGLASGSGSSSHAQGSLGSRLTTVSPRFHGVQRHQWVHFYQALPSSTATGKTTVTSGSGQTHESLRSKLTRSGSRLSSGSSRASGSTISLSTSRSTLSSDSRGAISTLHSHSTEAATSAYRGSSEAGGTSGSNLSTLALQEEEEEEEGKRGREEDRDGGSSESLVSGDTLLETRQCSRINIGSLANRQCSAASISGGSTSSTSTSSTTGTGHALGDSRSGGSNLTSGSSLSLLTVGSRDTLGSRVTLKTSGASSTLGSLGSRSSTGSGEARGSRHTSLTLEVTWVGERSEVNTDTHGGRRGHQRRWYQALLLLPGVRRVRRIQRLQPLPGNGQRTEPQGTNNRKWLAWTYLGAGGSGETWSTRRAKRSLEKEKEKEDTFRRPDMFDSGASGSNIAVSTTSTSGSSRSSTASLSSHTTSSLQEDDGGALVGCAGVQDSTVQYSRIRTVAEEESQERRMVRVGL
ncbi:hypothetical protein CRUP_008628 [Coryphaenoides rupestris]|nr:hypothetical protein CRUP_008628 [Coryphaenoides rupestris]